MSLKSKRSCAESVDRRRLNPAARDQTQRARHHDCDRQYSRDLAQLERHRLHVEALEQIVRQLEDGDLPLEKSLELFEQGIRLSRECQERLSQAERRIEILLRDNQGRPVAAAFKEGASDTATNVGREEENGL